MGFTELLGKANRRRTSIYGKASRFETSHSYWEQRYATGGNSGLGSYDELARFKADVLNQFIREQHIQSVVEFGCGDGNQLATLEAPQYLGLDVSATIVASCIKRFCDDPTKSFFLYDGTAFADRRGLFRAELALSLDVVYHLVEDDVFERYMTHLFHAAERFVVVYSSNRVGRPTAPHVRHRKFTDWVDARPNQWRLARHIPNRYPPQPGGEGGSFADFYIFQKRSDSHPGAADEG